MEEIWKDIEGLEGKYEVSSTGQINSLKRVTILSKGGLLHVEDRILSSAKDKAGYLMVRLTDRTFKKTIRVHRLVALAFIPNPENKRCVNHKNGIKDDNRCINLEWATHKENTTHALRTGLMKNNYISWHDSSKPVRQYSLDGRLINEYKSIRVACDKTGCNKGRVSQLCNGIGIQHHGFIWKFA